MALAQTMHPHLDGKGGEGESDGQDASGGEKRGGCSEGDPVCPITGRMFFDVFDFGFNGPMPLRWLRSYNSRTSHLDGDFGFGWSFSLGWELRCGRREIAVRDPHGRLQKFAYPAKGGFSWNGSGQSLEHRQGDSYIFHTDELETLTFTRLTNTRHVLAAIRDKNQNCISLERNARGHLVGMQDSAGRNYRIDCDDAGRITHIAVGLNAEGSASMLTAQYTYDEQGNLVSARDAEGYTSRYRYRDHLLIEHETASGLSYFYRYDGRASDAYCVETWGEYIGRQDPALDKPFPARQRSDPPLVGVKGIHYRQLTYVKPDRYCEAENSLGARRRSGHGVRRKEPAEDAQGPAQRRGYFCYALRVDESHRPARDQ